MTRIDQSQGLVSLFLVFGADGDQIRTANTRSFQERNDCVFKKQIWDNLPSCVDASGMFPSLKLSYDSGLKPLDSCHLKGWFQDGLQASVSLRLNTLVYSPIMRNKSLFLMFCFVFFVVKEMLELFYVENFQVVTILKKKFGVVVILNRSYCTVVAIGKLKLHAVFTFFFFYKCFENCCSFILILWPWKLALP